MTQQTLASFFFLCCAQLVLNVSASSECSKACLDNPLFCQSLTLLNFPGSLSQKKADSAPVICSFPFYSSACPFSCKTCVLCPENAADEGDKRNSDAPAAVQSESSQATQSVSTTGVPPSTTQAATSTPATATPAATTPATRTPATRTPATTTPATTTPATTTPATTTPATTTPATTTPATTTPATTTPATTAPATTTSATTTSVTTTKPTTPAPIDPVPIGVVTFSASKSYGSSYIIQKALDGDANTIYHSADNGNVFANFYIPKSRVTTVKVQNRADCCGERMTGEIVEVCDGDTECVECGAFPAVGNGEWGTMKCGVDQGIEGNVVKITSADNYLQIAEIEINGQAEDELKKMDIVGATSSGEHSTRYKLSNSYDNNDGTFFHSSGNDGFAKYQIEESDVTLVKVQNRPDCCAERLTNAKVYVCSDATDASCTHCGTFTGNYGKKEWAVMTCGGGDGIQGRFVKVQSSGTVLQITEIEIYANTD